MTLDETIKHAEEIAQDQENRANILWDSREKKYCRECAAEHRQLAEWLKDYKRLLEQEPCKDAISRETVVKYIKEKCNPYGKPSIDFEVGKKAIEYFKALPSVIPQEPILDKIRAEIEKDWQLKKYPSSPFSCGLKRAIEVIDKYKAEREDGI